MAAKRYSRGEDAARKVPSSMVQSMPFWWEDAPPLSPPQMPVQGRCDVVIVGAGYTGLSAGLTLARAGRQVQVFDRQRPGEGASPAATSDPAIDRWCAGSARPVPTPFRPRRRPREDLAEFIRREAIDCE